MEGSLIRALSSVFRYLTSPFKSGDSAGNSLSPRVAIAWSDIAYNPALRALTISNIEPDVTIQTVQNTNSMESLIDVGHITVRSNNAKYMDNLNLGDVVVWELNGETKIHAIVDIDTDEQGWYCYTQGVNIDSRDKVKVRKENIEWVALMVIWADTETFVLPPED